MSTSWVDQTSERHNHGKNHHESLHISADSFHSPVILTGPADYSHYNWCVLRSRDNPLVTEYNQGEVRVEVLHH
jgi:hypothetical protein